MRQKIYQEKDKILLRRFSLSREWQVLLGTEEIPAFAGIEIYNLEML
jgi:hypothetical protein